MKCYLAAVLAGAFLFLLGMAIRGPRYVMTQDEVNRDDETGWGSAGWQW